MEIKIYSARQKGDKNINFYTLILFVLFSFSILILCLVTTFFTWFMEGSEVLYISTCLILGLTIISWFFIRRCYYKIVFKESAVYLKSRLFFLSRKVRYCDIIQIVIDKRSSKRRLETADEFFEINHKDYAKLEVICKQKGLKIKLA